MGYRGVPRLVELDKVFHALDHSSLYLLSASVREPETVFDEVLFSLQVLGIQVFNFCKLGSNLASGACVATTLRKVPQWQLRNPEKHG